MARFTDVIAGHCIAQGKRFFNNFILYFNKLTKK